MIDSPPLFAWAHLSDLQLGRGSAGDDWDRKLVLDALADDLAQAAMVRGCPKLDAILVTGDVAWNGTVGQYAEAKERLAKIAQVAGVEKSRIYVVPGNHDVDRAADNDNNTKRLLKLLRRGDDPVEASLDDDGDRALLLRRLDPYLSFAKDLGSGAKPWWVHRIAVRGLQVRLVGMNTALLAADAADLGKLRLGRQQLHAAVADRQDGELIVVLSHHPFRGGWLADEVNADAWVRNHAHLHLFGHVKDHDSEGARRGSGGEFVRIAAGAAHTIAGDHGYNIAAIVRAEDGSLVVRIWPRRWSPVNAGFRDDVHNTPDGKRYAEHKVLRHVSVARAATIIVPSARTVASDGRDHAEAPSVAFRRTAPEPPHATKPTHESVIFRTIRHAITVDEPTIRRLWSLAEGASEEVVGVIVKYADLEQTSNDIETVIATLKKRTRRGLRSVTLTSYNTSRGTFGVRIYIDAKPLAHVTSRVTSHVSNEKASVVADAIDQCFREAEPRDGMRRWFYRLSYRWSGAALSTPMCLLFLVTVLFLDPSWRQRSIGWWFVTGMILAVTMSVLNVAILMIWPQVRFAFDNKIISRETKDARVGLAERQDRAGGDP